MGTALPTHCGTAQWACLEILALEIPSQSQHNLTFTDITIYHIHAHMAEVDDAQVVSAPTSYSGNASSNPDVYSMAMSAGVNLTKTAAVL